MPRTRQTIKSINDFIACVVFQKRAKLRERRVEAIKQLIFFAANSVFFAKWLEPIDGETELDSLPISHR